VRTAAEIDCSEYKTNDSDNDFEEVDTDNNDSGGQNVTIITLTSTLTLKLVVFTFSKNVVAILVISPVVIIQSKLEQQRKPNTILCHTVGNYINND
jgi:hypothetical protein